MKLVSNEKTEQNTVTLKFTIAKDVFDAQTEKVYNRKKNKITIQGFRPGKAPRHMIEKIYGKGVFYEDALNDLLPGEYAEALKESGIKAVAQPEIDVESIDENGVLVVAKVTVKPEVEIEGYTGIALSKETVKVTEKEVEEELENVRSRQGREIEVTDRPAKNGDTANIDYEGFADGVAFEGGKAEKQDLKLGSNTFIPGFEDQVIGHSVGDEFEIQVTFPTEYHAPELAGKDATFKIKLNGLKYTELPEVDDEFAKDVSEFDTLAEYKADLKAKIQMVNAEAENMLRDYDMNLRQNGLDLKTYLKYTGKELNDLREDFKPRAEKQLKLRLALEKIAQKENLSVTEEEIKKEIADLAAAYNMSADDVKAYVAKEDLENDLLSRKAMDLVKSTAKKPRASKKKASTEEPAGEQPAENKENKAE